MSAFGLLVEMFCVLGDYKQGFKDKVSFIFMSANAQLSSKSTLQSKKIKVQIYKLWKRNFRAHINNNFVFPHSWCVKSPRWLNAHLRPRGLSVLCGRNVFHLFYSEFQLARILFSLYKVKVLLAGIHRELNIFSSFHPPH